VNASGDGFAAPDHCYGNAEFRNACDELARSIQRVHHPNTFFIKTAQIIRALLREPALSRLQQFLPQRSINRAVSLSDGIVAGLVFSFDLARSKAAQNTSSGFERRLYAL